MFNILEPYYVDMDIMISYSRLFDHTEEENIIWIIYNLFYYTKLLMMLILSLTSSAECNLMHTASLYEYSTIWNIICRDWYDM